MKVLFIGGTGVISSACSELAVQQGVDLYLLNRGLTTDRPIPAGATVLTGDIRDFDSVTKALAGHEFDVVVDFIAFVPEHIEMDIKLFGGRVKQYIFISSASAYQTPPQKLPITEETPLENPYWLYSRNKIACEDRLMQAYHEDGFPVTVVRPSHTYDKTKVPLIGRYTALDRMIKGKPVLVHGDGSSLWTLTHHRDFAKGFNGLLGNKQAIGEAVHITSDEWLTWNQIYETLARAAGVSPKFVYLPSRLIHAYDHEVGEGLLGDKMHNMILDNSKLKRLVPGFEATIPFAEGAKEIVAWYGRDISRQVVEQSWNSLFEQLIRKFQLIVPFE
ncbi:MAG: nucleoside-diphosphate-sugar epimerase [Cellvibrionaceae bacterium]|jgi:nucleoside-diphosphate-sugar epimerase